MIPPVPEGRLRVVRLDGVWDWRLQCPACGCEGSIDGDQLRGRVSVDHRNCTGPGSRGMECAHPCTFHETRDWAATARPGNEAAADALGRPVG